MNRTYDEFGDETIVLSYDDTFRGLIFRRYRDMKARVNGCPHKRARSEGLPIVSKEEFVAWSLDDDQYAWYYQEWKDSNYNIVQAPSIHRLDFTQGYVFGNMEWISVCEHITKTVEERRPDNWTGSR